MPRLVMTEEREAPEIARPHRERVLDPLAAQIQRWAQIATDRGEVNDDALQRSPLLLLSPAILAAPRTQSTLPTPATASWIG